MDSDVRILIAADGSGGHIIPALEVSRALVRAHASVWLMYATRASTGPLLQELLPGVQAECV